MSATRTEHSWYTVYDAVTALALAEVVLTAAASVRSAMQAPLSFDDSYMFARYARQLRAGNGFSWNAAGGHTYGPTSLLWSAVVWLGSFLPGGTWPKLVALSAVFAALACVAIAWAVAANLPVRGWFADAHGRRSTARVTYRVLPWVALPLLATPVLRGNMGTGMETMLALCLCGLFTGAALLWRNGRASLWAVAILGLLLYLARPEAAVVAGGLPLLLWVCVPAPRPAWQKLVLLLAALLAGIGAELLLARLYFGTAVPLSVYMKGHHAYLGYRGVWHPALLLAGLLLAAWPYLAATTLFARGNTLRVALCCAAPAAAIFCYLQRVTQIMGFHSRYYVPYLPLLVVPALLALADTRVASGGIASRAALRPGAVRIVTVTLMFIVLAALSSEGVAARVRQAANLAREEYDAPVLTMAATKPLPALSWQNAAQDVSDLLVRPLPSGTTVAATEVGYLGERAPQVDVIDLAGLNDTEIALHGFSMDDLLCRHPDVIWMPNTDYTYQRGEMLADPRFLAQYNLYADAGNYGIALRKDSPQRAAIDAAFRDFWSRVYPGDRAADYLVTAATWSGAHHTVRGE